jgi:hypothetical protein
MEVTLLDYRFIRAKPSFIAAVGMYIARRMLDGDWVGFRLSLSSESVVADGSSYRLAVERRLRVLL